jgi:hypothetical protein
MALSYSWRLEVRVGTEVVQHFSVRPHHDYTKSRDWDNAMAFIPVADTAEVVMTYTLPNGNVAKNVYNIREALISVWNPAQLQFLIDEFVTWEDTVARAQRTNQVTLTKVEARDLSAPDSFIVENAVSLAGTQPVAGLPANVTFAVKSVTGLAGRTHRGRTYWVGLWETAVSGDFLLVAVANNIQAALNTLRTGMVPNGWAMVVVSRTLNGVPRVAGLATDISSWQYLDTRVDTQRRRLIGEGQ